MIEAKVLIIDDEHGDTSTAGALVNCFERFNNGTLSSLPKPLQDSAFGRYKFEVEHITDPYTIPDSTRHTLKEYSVFVIDRKYVLGNEMKDLNCTLLEPLKALRVPGLRIVWTSFADDDPTNTENFNRDLILCMRLGAWDYLDKKKSRLGDICTDLVVSALEGLEACELEAAKSATDQAALKYVMNHYRTIYEKHKGQFVAFERKSQKDAEFVELTAHRSLIGLCLKLKDMGKGNTENLHITQIIV